jgi:hypothetical protein
MSITHHTLEDLEKALHEASLRIEQLERENHVLKCRLEEHRVTHWPRIKDLPENEQVPFRKWLTGQTVPLIPTLPYEEQDAYYQWDYDRWKETFKGKSIFWD